MRDFKQYTTDELFGCVRAWGNLSKPAQDALTEIQRRSQAGVHERLARVEQDLAEFKAKHRTTLDLLAAGAQIEGAELLRDRLKVAGAQIDHSKTDFTSLEWRVVVAQLDTADSKALDDWGATLGVPRRSWSCGQTLETDANYRGRLLFEARLVLG